MMIVVMSVDEMTVMWIIMILINIALMIMIMMLMIKDLTLIIVIATMFKEGKGAYSGSEDSNLLYRRSCNNMIMIIFLKFDIYDND